MMEPERVYPLWQQHPTGHLLRKKAENCKGGEGKKRGPSTSITAAKKWEDDFTKKRKKKKGLFLFFGMPASEK